MNRKRDLDNLGLLYESAYLAALLPNPSKYSKKNFADIRNRRIKHIVKQMEQLGGVKYLERL